MQYLKYLPYLIMIAAIYYVINANLDSIQNKKKNALKYVLNNKSKDSKYIAYLKKKGLYKWISPNQIIHEGKEFNWNLTIKDYSMLLIVGSLIGVIIFYGFFISVNFAVFGVIVGLVLPRIMMFYKKKRYELYVEEQLMLYLNSLANAMSAYENPSFAIKSILPLMQSPIKEDVENCLIVHLEGTSIKESFEPLINKYKYKNLKLFHDMLDLISKTGKDEDGLLMRIADEFQQKKIYKAKLKAGMEPKRSSFKKIAIMTASFPFMFLAVTADDYIVFAGTPTGKIILTLMILVNIICAVKVEQHSFYDPTEGINKIS
ncbi:hypothetical protein BC30090_p258 (plasmid) [Bacillus cereus]|nr:hypothetical protein [Bacillus cereus]BCC21369.1 hypothetical protein BCM0075_p262 [Bacillus cereus]BCD08973.1 hypothetical protein BC30052_p305 [Bacillus cereus]BCD26852.1 hypothetical protein BC30090_p258 [Bacillus cereus]SMD66088.1 hypothetical protein BACERE00184_00578 [Bacillus cereus]